jgi:hypothetical protein
VTLGSVTVTEGGTSVAAWTTAQPEFVANLAASDSPPSPAVTTITTDAEGLVSFGYGSLVNFRSADTTLELTMIDGPTNCGLAAPTKIDVSHWYNSDGSNSGYAPVVTGQNAWLTTEWIHNYGDGGAAVAFAIEVQVTCGDVKAAPVATPVEIVPLVRFETGLVG